MILPKHLAHSRRITIQSLCFLHLFIFIFLPCGLWQILPTVVPWEVMYALCWSRRSLDLKATAEDVDVSLAYISAVCICRVCIYWYSKRRKVLAIGFVAIAFLTCFLHVSWASCFWGRENKPVALKVERSNEGLLFDWFATLQVPHFFVTIQWDWCEILKFLRIPLKFLLWFTFLLLANILTLWVPLI